MAGQNIIAGIKTAVFRYTTPGTGSTKAMLSMEYMSNSGE